MPNIYQPAPSAPTSLGGVTRFLRVDVHGSYYSKAIQNTLWYATKNDATLVPSELAIDFAVEWALSIKDNWLACHDNEYTLQDLGIQVYSSTWLALLSQPYTSIQGSAGVLNKSSAGRAQSLVLGFILDISGAIIPTGMSAPKHSYIHFGPVGENAIANNGDLVASDYTAGSLEALMSGLQTVVVGASTNAYIPVRVSQENDLNQRSVAEVTAAYIRERVSNRKSRNKG